MNDTVNKYLAKHHSVELDTNGSVIAVPNMIEMWDSMMNDPYLKLAELVGIYDMFATFLKTPLTLDMFIAVDEEGKFMEEPNAYSDFCTATFYEIIDWNPVVLDECKVYQDAQKRIIFDGWRLLSMKGSEKNMNLFLRDKFQNKLNFFEGNVWQGTRQIKTVGDLLVLIRLFAKIAA